MPFELVRRPRSARRLHSIVRKEVRASYKTLAVFAVRRLEQDIEDWGEQPEFKTKVVVGMKRWSIRIDYDRESEIGEIYGWVDEGTGTYIGNDAYEIFPVDADSLKFSVPYDPKTIPDLFGAGLGIVLEAGDVQQDDVFAKRVLHPGIRPRNFTKSLQDFLKHPTKVGGFRSVTEAAIKRAFRQMGLLDRDWETLS